MFGQKLQWISSNAEMRQTHTVSGAPLALLLFWTREGKHLFRLPPRDSLYWSCRRLGRPNQRPVFRAFVLGQIETRTVCSKLSAARFFTPKQSKAKQSKTAEIHNCIALCVCPLGVWGREKRRGSCLGRERKKQEAEYRWGLLSEEFGKAVPSSCLAAAHTHTGQSEAEYYPRMPAQFERQAQRQLSTGPNWPKQKSFPLATKSPSERPTLSSCSPVRVRKLVGASSPLARPLSSLARRFASIQCHISIPNGNNNNSTRQNKHHLAPIFHIGTPLCSITVSVRTSLSSENCKQESHIFSSGAPNWVRLHFWQVCSKCTSSRVIQTTEKNNK